MSTWPAYDFRPYFQSLIVGQRDGKPVYDLTTTARGKSLITFNTIMQAIRAGHAFGVYTNSDGEQKEIQP